MSKLTPADWVEVQRIIGRCVRGGGYVPERRERKLLEAAIKEDPARYGAHRRMIKNGAVAEMLGKPAPEERSTES